MGRLGVSAAAERRFSAAAALRLLGGREHRRSGGKRAHLPQGWDSPSGSPSPRPLGRSFGARSPRASRGAAARGRQPFAVVAWGVALFPGTGRTGVRGGPWGRAAGTLGGVREAEPVSPGGCCCFILTSQYCPVSLPERKKYRPPGV